MKSILIDVKDRFSPVSGNILVFDGKEWECVPKSSFLGDLLRANIELREEVGKLKSELDKSKNDIKTLAKAMKENL